MESKLVKLQTIIDDSFDRVQAIIIANEDGLPVASRINPFSKELEYFLSAVVSSDRALTEFKQGTPLKDAARFTEQPTEVFKESLRKAREEMTIAQANIHNLRNYDNADFEILEEIGKMASFMKTAFSKSQ